MLLSLQMIAANATGNVLVLGLYVATVIVVALFGRQWFVFASVNRFKEEGSPERGSGRSSIAMLLIFSSTAGLGAFLGAVLAGVSPRDTILLVGGGAGMVLAFVVASLGAGVLLEAGVLAGISAEMK